MKRAIWMLAILILFSTACAAPSASVSEMADYYIEITTPTAGSDKLDLSIINATGTDAEILLIPTLEILNDEGVWEVIAMDNGTGFCGTPDPLPDGGTNWSMDRGELWNNLYAGKYRLSYNITDAAGKEYTASGEFTLTYDIVKIER